MAWPLMIADWKIVRGKFYTYSFDSNLANKSLIIRLTMIRTGHFRFFLDMIYSCVDLHMWLVSHRKVWEFITVESVVPCYNVLIFFRRRLRNIYNYVIDEVFRKVQPSVPNKLKHKLDLQF